MNSMANRVGKVAPSALWVNCHDPCGCNQALTWGSTYRTDDTIFSEESRRRSRFMAYLHRQGAGWRQ